MNSPWGIEMITCTLGFGAILAWAIGHGVLWLCRELRSIASDIRVWINRDRNAAVLASHDQAEATLRDAIDLDLMDIALTTCDDCRFWNDLADRAEFLPCPAHEGLFTS